MDDNIYSSCLLVCQAKGLPLYPPPIPPEVEVEAVSPDSPSTLKLKDEEETILQCAKEKRI